METYIYTAFFDLVRIGLTQGQLTDTIDEEIIPEILVLARQHDVTPIVLDSVVNLYPNTTYKNELYSQITRMMRIEYEQSEIMDALNEARIKFVILKGTVLRQMYPKSWMRTSCDIDILVHDEDLNRAVNVLVSELDFKVEGHKHYHDINLYSPDGVHLELHHTILENTENIDCELINVWNYVIPLPSFEYGYQETPEFFYFHHLAHMSYHLVNGGCGIRPFIDLWVMEQNLSINTTTLNTLLTNTKLLDFYHAVWDLSRYWLSASKGEVASLTDVEQELELFVFNGSAGGSREQSMAVKNSKAGGRMRYLLSRLFIPYSSLIYLYPWIENRKWLVPVATILRWGTVLKSDVLYRVKREIKLNNSIDAQQQTKILKLMSDLGIQG